MVANILQTNETLVVTYQRHWFYLFKEVVAFVIVGVALPLFVSPLLLSLPTFSIIPGNLFLLAITLCALWALFIVPMVATVWTDYYLDLLCLTSHRVVDIEQKGLFNRNVASVRYENIQDVTVEVEGIIASFLNFGTIHIQTAGAAREFVLSYVANPSDVKARILDQQQTLRNKQ